MTLDPNRCRCGHDCRCRNPWGTRRQYAHKWAVSPAVLMPQPPLVWITPTQCTSGFKFLPPMQAGVADTFAKAED